MSALASLPMYQLPGTAPAWSALWAHLGAGLRAAGFRAPRSLSRPGDLHRHWRDPRLLLSQTCVRPMRLGLHEQVAPVATFDFKLPGCAPGQYNSTLIARLDGPATGRVAYNGTDSQSGYAALIAAGIDPTDGLCTGAHRASVRAVQIGAADIAAIDSYTWRLLGATPGARSGLRVIGVTPPVPGTPLITGPTHDAATVANTLVTAMERVPQAVLHRLSLGGIVPVDPADYRP